MHHLEQQAIEAMGRAAPPSSASAGPDRYWAFLSYSHADSAAAARLHRWLETYQIPPHLVGQGTARGEVPRRLAPIFRDTAELPASGDLDEVVKTALAQSRALVVLCSPNAAASRWVDQEITYFEQMYPDRPVLAALLDGEPREAFPPALTRPGENGQPREPAAADFRKGGDSRLARLRLVAGLTGLGLDELIQRDSQRQVRRVTAITLLALLSVLIMAALLFSAVSARNEAERQRQQAEGLIEFMLTDLRSKLEGVGRLDILSSVNHRAFAYYGAQGDLSRLSGVSLERRARLLQAMGADDQKRGLLKTAVAEFSEAQRVTGALLAEDPDDPERVFAHAQSEFWIGYVDFQRDHMDKARQHFLAYLKLAQKLVRLRPNDPMAVREIGYAQGNICSLEVTEGASKPALAACRSALAAMEEARRLKGDDPALLADIANRHAWVADALKAQHRFTDALAERRRQAALIDGLVRLDPANATYRLAWLLCRYSTAMLLREMGDETAARHLAGEAKQAVAELSARDPSNRDWRSWRKRIDSSFSDQ